MFRTAKKRLTHVSPSTMRYRFARKAMTAQKIREAHACVFYWIYLPSIAIALAVKPIFSALCYVVSRPIAWMAGYEKVGPFFPQSPDEPVEEVYQNAHVQLAPWRIVLPALALIGFLIVGVLVGPGFFVWSVIIAAIVTVVVLVGWVVYLRRQRIAETFDRLCPRLEIDG